jgi:hypothetical protein
VFTTKRPLQHKRLVLEVRKCLSELLRQCLLYGNAVLCKALPRAKVVVYTGYGP